MIKYYLEPIIFTLILMFFSTVLSMSVPLTVHEVIQYIEDKNRSLLKGIIIVGIIFISRFIMVLFNSHADGFIVI
jgi:hypothetical protein